MLVDEEIARVAMLVRGGLRSVRRRAARIAWAQTTPKSSGDAQQR